MNNQTQYRLADNVVMEPLVQDWFAWSFVVAPATSALHALHYQIPVMRSYLANPALHIKACSDPELMGGPFLDIAPERVSEVEALLSATETMRAAHLELARSIQRLQNLVASEGHGQSLEPYYERVPARLKGFVELVYNYDHRAMVRLLEPLLYVSDYSTRGFQSIRCFALDRDEDRAFFMSTPRLPREHEIRLHTPFDDGRIDEICRLHDEPQTLPYIADLLGIDDARAEECRSLLSQEPAASSGENWSGTGMRIRYIGHACALVSWKGYSILVDPYIPVKPRLAGTRRYSYHDLPQRIDYALITHNHQDHFSLETLLRLRRRIKCVVVPRSLGLLYGDISLKTLLHHLKFENVVELDTLESIPIEDGEIIGVPFLGEHGDLAHSKSAYVVRAGTEQVLFAADADCLDPSIYQQIRGAIGAVANVFLGTESVGAPLSWTCGPLFPQKLSRECEESRRYHGSNAERGLRLLEALEARNVFIYAMGLEPWMRHILGLALTERSPQWLESEALLAGVAGRGFVHAERLCGGKDIFPRGRRSRPIRGIPDAPSAFPTCGASISEGSLWRRVVARRRPENASVCATMRLPGPLDSVRLQSTLEQIVARHDALRRGFDTRGSELLPAANGLKWSFGFRVLDSNSLLGPGTTEAETVALVRSEQNPFDPAQGPLTRVTAVPRSAGEWTLVVEMDRLVGDRSSLRLFARELWRGLYPVGTAPQQDPCEAPTPFARIEQIEREWLDSKEGEEAFLNWRRRLSRLSYFEGAFQAPMAAPRTIALWDEDGPAQAQSLPLNWNGITDTRPIVFFAAACVVVSFARKQERLRVRTTIDRRRWCVAPNTIGPLSNDVLLLVDLSGQPTCRELLRRAGEVLQRAEESAIFPLDLLNGTGEGRESSTSGNSVSFTYLDVNLFDGDPAEVAFRDVTSLGVSHDEVLLLVDQDYRRAVLYGSAPGGAEVDDGLLPACFVSAVQDILTAPEKPLAAICGGVSQLLSHRTSVPPEDASATFSF